MKSLSHSFLVKHLNTSDFLKGFLSFSQFICSFTFQVQPAADLLLTFQQNLKKYTKSNRKMAVTPETHKIIGKHKMLFWTRSMYKCVFWNHVRKEEVLQVKFTVALEHFSDSPDVKPSVLLVTFRSATITFALTKLKTRISPSRIQEVEIHLTLTWHNIFRHYTPRLTKEFTHTKLNHLTSFSQLTSSRRYATSPLPDYLDCQVKFFSLGISTKI